VGGTGKSEGLRGGESRWGEGTGDNIIRTGEVFLTGQKKCAGVQMEIKEAPSRTKQSEGVAASKALWGRGHAALNPTKKGGGR